MADIASMAPCLGLAYGLFVEKKEEIWPSPMTKTPTSTEKKQKATRQHTIADRLRTVSGSNHSHTTVVLLNRFTSAQPCDQKDTH